MEPGPSSLGAWSLSHWTTQEVPICVLFDDRQSDWCEVMPYCGSPHPDKVLLRPLLQQGALRTNNRFPCLLIL